MGSEPMPCKGGSEYCLSMHKALGRSVSAGEMSAVKPLDTLEWTTKVKHDTISLVGACLTKVPPPAQHLVAAPGYCLEVWAAGERRGDEIAYCRSSLRPQEKVLHVHWLARLQKCTHICVGDRDVTVAVAVLAVSALLGQRFCLHQVELEAEDDGSGRLVSYYLDLGFHIVSDKPRPALRKGQPAMRAPSHVLASCAPSDWTLDLVPASFDPDVWLREYHKARAHELLIGDGDIPSHWSWKVAQPHGAKVSVDLDCKPSCVGSCNRLRAQAVLWDCHGIELACAKGSVNLKHRSLALQWLGRSTKDPVHASIKSRKLYDLTCVDCRGQSGGDKRDVAVGRADKDKESENQDEAVKVTAAVALLGALALLANRIGAVSVEVPAMAKDDGSGGLLRYFARFGFQEAPKEYMETSLLTVSCKELASSCCPESWRSELPTPKVAQAMMLKRRILGSGLGDLRGTGKLQAALRR
eukprot:gnl/TRDRNA2_/TRDRNA2_198473_c0_seq1.p1 gnl/TRDRNA2_/TRDRNA2_198473_c0~~gnl/TRDRNA2_/TRDRNA2_198473_c0_seq1.p1  ORF type:complete len:469 (+),score=62.17 gnl/TRDRNA2_/TRDRNA2_198473_c0_seq1:97-1503(+)